MSKICIYINNKGWKKIERNMKEWDNKDRKLIIFKIEKFNKVKIWILKIKKKKKDKWWTFDNIDLVIEKRD